MSEETLTQSKNDELHKNAINDVDKLKRQLDLTFDEMMSYKEIVETILVFSPIMMWIKDKDGRYEFANNKAVHGLFLADSKDDVIGKTDAQLSELAKQKSVKPYTIGDRQVETDKIAIEKQESTTFITKGTINGRDAVLNVIKVPRVNYNGEVTGVVGVAYDVTDSRKEIETINNTTKDPNTAQQLAVILAKGLKYA